MIDRKAHNKIFKSISIFGSLQAIQMICKIVSVKITTLILGPVGVGLIGMIDNVINILTQSTSFGIQTIGTQMIAKEKENLINQKGLFIWMLICSVLSGLFCFVFSGYLSEITFESNQYSLHFKALSLYFVLYGFVNFAIIILKGLNDIKRLVKYQILSVILISITTIASFLIFGKNGIFPAFIANSLVTFFVYFSFLSKMKIKDIRISKKQILLQGKYLFSKGSLLALNGVFGLFCFFFIRLYLKNNNPDYLGFYEVANLYLVAYFGIIFSSLANDYFPTLTNKFARNENVNSFVNIQIQTSILITTPLVLIMYCGYDFIIPLLASKDFLPVREILLFGLVSILCKTINYPIGYIMLATDDVKSFFYQNIISDIFILLLTLLCFYLFGLLGIGLAMLLNYAVFNVYLLHFVSKRNLFKMDNLSIKYILISFLFAFFMIAIELTITGFFLNISKALISVIGISYCIFELNKNNQFLTAIKNKFKK